MQTNNNHETKKDDFRKLPLAERRKILRRQARQILDCYTNNPDITGLGGGDFVELTPAR